MCVGNAHQSKSTNEGGLGEFTPGKWVVLAIAPKKHQGGSNKDCEKSIFILQMKPI